MILSVSRRTDIPNYYSDWFMNRLKEGYLYVRNPFNAHLISKIVLSPEVVDCIVFWTKNPTNMMKYLEDLKDYQYYFQFTITSYGKDIEPNLPNKKEIIIPTFKALSDRIGKDRVILRYDPILMNERYTIDYHIEAFNKITSALSGYTNKVVISFIDIYSKILKNTKEFGIKQLSSENMRFVAKNLAVIAKQNHMTIESCAESIDLKDIGISHGSCIDKETIENIIGGSLKCMKDKNQRAECGCIESIDVGTYNTCCNGCIYCYANYSHRIVARQKEKYSVFSPLLCERVNEMDRIIDRKVVSLKEQQISLFDRME